MTFRILLLCLLAALGACASVEDRRASGAPAKLSKQWLAGGWILAGDPCDSDAGVIYRRNGRWLADGAAGKWSLRKGRLVSIVTEQETEQGATARLDPPQRHVQSVEMIGPNEIRLRGEDGSDRRLRRCPDTTRK